MINEVLFMSILISTNIPIAGYDPNLHSEAPIFARLVHEANNQTLGHIIQKPAVEIRWSATPKFYVKKISWSIGKLSKYKELDPLGIILCDPNDYQFIHTNYPLITYAIPTKDGWFESAVFTRPRIKSTNMKDLMYVAKHWLRKED